MLEEQEATDRQVAGVDERRGVLGHVEVAPGDGVPDGATGGSVELTEITGQVGVVLVDRHGKDIGLDGGGGTDDRAQAHSAVTPLRW